MPEVAGGGSFTSYKDAVPSHIRRLLAARNLQIADFPIRDIAQPDPEPFTAHARIAKMDQWLGARPVTVHGNRILPGSRAF
ncbi:hypothetical protein D3C86_2095760 [compost metagenome]